MDYAHPAKTVLEALASASPQMVASFEHESHKNQLHPNIGLSYKNQKHASQHQANLRSNLLKKAQLEIGGRLMTYGLGLGRR